MKEPDYLVRMADEIGGELGGDDQVYLLTRIVPEVEEPPEQGIFKDTNEKEGRRCRSCTPDGRSYP